MASESKGGEVAASGGAANVQLHPLVLMNIADHYTRVMMKGDKHDRVIGVVFGKQTGGDIIILHLSLATAQLHRNNRGQTRHLS